MPANRSRTLNWRRCLDQIVSRGGTIEIAVSPHPPAEPLEAHLIWRVRLLRIDKDSLLVEQPAALGRVIPLHPATELVGMLSIGQNRWMFLTTIREATEQRQGSRTTPALRLEMPDSVERCSRRHHYRVETTSLTLPSVDVWPLMDPKSVMVAERANELQVEQELNGRPAEGLRDIDFQELMPEVGPRFTGSLLNLGGGGVGLQVEPAESQPLARHKLFWIRIPLPPALQTPICASAKLIHTHMDSSQRTYAGLAFDFAFNPDHQNVVVNQICKYIVFQQDAQQSAQRRSA